MSALRFVQGSYPIIGMVHLAALPGAPRFTGDFSAVLEAARRDARALSEGGVDAIMIENFNDTPFTAGSVEPETIAALTAAALAVRGVSGLPIGINVLRNDGVAALGIAAAVGAAFVRINILAGTRITDQGLISGDAYRVLRTRARVAPQTQIWADVDVKHSAPIAPRPIEERVAELTERAGAEAVIVSGSGTGAAASAADLERVERASAAPVLVGSGLTVATLPSQLRHSSGAIVGTSIKVDGRVLAPVDPSRVRALIDARDASLQALA